MGCAGLAVAPQAEGPDWTLEAPVEVADLAAGAHAHMQMLYERTIFNVDVLHLTLVLGADTLQELGPLLGSRAVDRDAIDRAADRMLETRDALVRTRFLRALDLDQFLDGVADNLDDAHAAELIDEAERDRILAGMHEEWAVLRPRGIRPGDTAWYRIEGDSVRVVFQTLSGELPVDLHIEGAEHRRAILGGYLAPGSDFREPLIRSLLERSAQADAAS